MEKLNVTVGFVFTGVMFCDAHGKLQFHRVLTDVDKPWESVKEVLGWVRQALSIDQSKFLNSFLPAIHVQLEFKKMNFQSYLIQLRDKLVAAFSSCFILIEDLVEENVQATLAEEEKEETMVMEFTPVECGEEVEVEVVSPAAEDKPTLFVISSSASKELKGLDRRSRDERGQFTFVDGQNVRFVRDNYERGSPLLYCS